MENQQITYQLGDKLYLSITDRCTLECIFCPRNRGGCRISGHDLTIRQRPTATQVIEAVGNPGNYREVVFCGFGEPTMRLNLMLEVAAELKKRGARHQRLVTDGLANLVHKDNVLPALAESIDSISVSLNAQDPETYEYYCQPALPGSYEAMLQFLADAPQYFSRVEATAIDSLDGVDLDACARLAEERGAGFRVRPLDGLL